MRPIRQANYRLEDAYSSFYYILDLWWGGKNLDLKNSSYFVDPNSSPQPHIPLQ